MHRGGVKQNKLKASLKLKDGTSYAAGLSAVVAFVGNGSTLATLTIGGRTFRIRASKLCKYVTGFDRPSQQDLEEWSEDSGCETISGDWVEPDGWGPDGAPSWLLALGLI